jgi:hypothetical protein
MDLPRHEFGLHELGRPLSDKTPITPAPQASRFQSGQGAASLDVSVYLVRVSSQFGLFTVEKETIDWGRGCLVFGKKCFVRFFCVFGGWVGAAGCVYGLVSAGDFLVVGSCLVEGPASAVAKRMRWLEIRDAVVATAHKRNDVISSPLLALDVAVSADAAGELCAGEDYLAVALVLRV